MFAPDPDHPLGLTNNPEWASSRRVREALYLRERQRRIEDSNEPFPTGPITIGVVLGLSILPVFYLIGFAIEVLK